MEELVLKSVLRDSQILKKLKCFLSWNLNVFEFSPACKIKPQWLLFYNDAVKLYSF